jgi:hypothetical protein
MRGGSANRAHNPNAYYYNAYYYVTSWRLGGELRDITCIELAIAIGQSIQG